MKKTLSLALLACMAVAPTAFAGSADQGHFSVGAGVVQVQPRDHTANLAGSNVSLSDSTRLGLSGEYFVRDNLGVELAVNAPFKQAVTLEGAGRVGTTKSVQPSLSANYHFNADGKVSPYVGVGVGYARFYETRTDGAGALAGQPTTLSSSWGGAAQAGVDFKVTAQDSIRLSARYTDQDSTVRTNGAAVAKLNVDPMTYGVSYVRGF